MKALNLQIVSVGQGESRSNPRFPSLRQNYKSMLKLFLVCVLIIAICVIFLCTTIILKKNGRFPNTHVSGNKAMRERGIRCVQSQDLEMRIDNPHAVKEKGQNNKK